MSLTVQRVDAVMHELGFAQVEAAAHFHWYESPVKARRVELDAPNWVRVMYYAPRNDVQVWLVPKNGLHTHDMFGGILETAAQLTEVLSAALRARQDAAVEELVKWNDKRLEAVPEDLIRLAHSPYKHERFEAQAVIADLLLERGIPF